MEEEQIENTDLLFKNRHTPIRHAQQTRARMLASAHHSARTIMHVLSKNNAQVSSNMRVRVMDHDVSGTDH